VFSYFSQVMAESHIADLTEQARRARLASAARAAGRRPTRLRLSTARLLVALAVRLDDRLQLAPVHASTSGTRI
jgi:hypothetical protein